MIYILHYPQLYQIIIITTIIPYNNLKHNLNLYFFWLLFFLSIPKTSNHTPHTTHPHTRIRIRIRARTDKKTANRHKYATPNSNDAK